ncbi:MAG: hypothetical protein HZA93_26735 [Verrucomicrobia bacterium]|nr:hypothetical protein [Verrucomicrobiota bacterium]
MKLLRTHWFVLAGALLLFVRKPWALHTPQLHAEDGSVFLLQDDLFGAPVVFEPYAGYLHLIPRLVAWLASHTVDVAWWPALYNGAAFLFTVALLARIASPRLDVPGKPWLALALVLVTHTGEAFINLTNLQWVTAFFLLLPLFMKPATSWLGYLVDYSLLLLIGLTGPFAIVFLPLYVWRAWRQRDRHAFGALSVIAACAAVQLTFMVRTDFPGGAAPGSSHPDVFLAVIACRLFIWPVFGLSAAFTESVWGRGLFGCAALLALLAWSLRPHPRRAERAQLVAAFVLITLACVARARPDRWETMNLVNGDRYFYIPRVLVAWLLIWEFDAAPRAIAYTARALCVCGVLINLPGLQLPAPPDYRWAENCAPIRQGVPGKVPTLPEGWLLEYPGRPRK